MQVNNITVPDAGRAVEFITDPIGGWVYEVETITSVTPHNMTKWDKIVADAQADVDSAVKRLTALQDKTPTIEVAPVVGMDEPVVP